MNGITITSRAERDAAEKAIAEFDAKKNTLWYPKPGEHVHWLNINKPVCGEFDPNNECHQSLLRNGMIRQTRELAIQADNVARAKDKIRKFIADNGFEIGREKNGYCWTLRYNVLAKKWVVTAIDRDAFLNIPLLHRAAANRVLAECAEDLAVIGGGGAIDEEQENLHCRKNRRL